MTDLLAVLADLIGPLPVVQRRPLTDDEERATDAAIERELDRRAGLGYPASDRECEFAAADYVHRKST